MDKISEQNNVVYGIILWFTLALIAGASGITFSMVPPFPQIVLFGLTLVLFLLFWLSGSFRSWILSVVIRLLAGVPLTRFVGFYFLYLYSLNRHPLYFFYSSNSYKTSYAGSAVHG